MPATKTHFPPRSVVRITMTINGLTRCAVLPVGQDGPDRFHRLANADDRSETRFFAGKPNHYRICQTTYAFPRLRSPPLMPRATAVKTTHKVIRTTTAGRTDRTRRRHRNRLPAAQCPQPSPDSDLFANHAESPADSAGSCRLLHGNAHRQFGLLLIHHYAFA